MSATDFLRRIVRHLEDAGVPYMVAGSLASTFHGRPRTTEDIDLVVELDAAALLRVLSLDPERYYVSEEAASDALRRESQFNVIDMETGWKADLIVRKSRPFSETEFSRRERVRLLGVDCHVASAEDTILAKLEWAKQGESERQLRDVVGVLSTRGDDLDVEYIEKWADALGIRDLWEQVLRQGAATDG